MMSQAKQKGFTIIELLIVIVVIGILATITAVAYSGVQESGRNSDRQADAKSLQSGLEIYHTSGNSQYPTLAEFNDQTFRDEHFKGYDEEAFTDPNADNSTFVDAPAANVYAYVPGPTGCDNVTTPCTEYTLTVTLEGGEDPIVKTNLQ